MPIGADVSSTAKVSSQGQTVLPKEVREKLGIRPGDTVRFRETDRGVVIERVETLYLGDAEWNADPFASFTEWARPEEDEAWKDL